MSGTQPIPGEAPGRLVPQPGAFVDTSPFWEGVREHRLVLQYCADTGQFQHFPRPVSIFTGSRNLQWRAVSGGGTIYACTVLRVPGPGLEGRLPLVVATIELDERVRILGNILGAAPGATAIGQRVVLAWDRLADGVDYPAFRLAG